jgi:hypothetical protein
MRAPLLTPYTFYLSQPNFVESAGVSAGSKQKMFLKQAIGAAYTPLSIGADGKLYVQNAGHLLVVGN